MGSGTPPLIHVGPWAPKLGLGPDPGPKFAPGPGPVPKLILFAHGPMYIPGIARLGKISLKLVFQIFGRILVRDVFHWIQVAETPNLPVVLPL